MRVRPVIRHDFAVIWRTSRRWIHLVASLTAIIIGVYFGTSLTDADFTKQYSVVIFFSGGFVFPAIALLGSAVSIAGDRESGRLRLLLSSPIIIKDIYIGTVLSRSMIYGFLASALFVITVGAITINPDSRSATLLILVVASIVLVLINTIAGVVISVIASTRLRAVIGAIVFYLWSYSWPQVVSERLVTEGEVSLLFLSRMSPFGAYAQIAGPLILPGGGLFHVPVKSPLLTPPSMFVLLLLFGFVFFFLPLVSKRLD